MTKTNLIGLDLHLSEELAKRLNNLLANYQVFYINTRGFHWNIKGDKFFELHAKFEELYNDSLIKIDEIAERILTLGHKPDHTYTDFLKNSSIKETKNISDGVKAVKEVLSGFEKLIKIEREILELSDEANDEGTTALVSDYIRQQEKLVWMYSSYLQ
jgi:starvation-inducible DNA-binding protein